MQSLISMPKTTTETDLISNNRHSETVQATRARIRFTGKVGLQCRPPLWVCSQLAISMDWVALCWARPFILRPLFWGTEGSHLSLCWLGVRHVVRMVWVATQATSRVTFGWGKWSYPWTTTFGWSRVELRAIVSSAKTAFVDLLTEVLRTQGLCLTVRWTMNNLVSSGVLWGS